MDNLEKHFMLLLRPEERQFLKVCFTRHVNGWKPWFSNQLSYVDLKTCIKQYLTVELTNLKYLNKAMVAV